MSSMLSGYGGRDAQTRKVKLRTSIDLESAPTITSFLPPVIMHSSLKVNGKYVSSSKEWTEPRLSRNFGLFSKPVKID